jgi:hypothetical protein
MAPQVGLEPTTLRLTAKTQACAGLLVSALVCSLSRSSEHALNFRCEQDYSEFAVILIQGTHKSPHIRLTHVPPQKSRRFTR